MPAVFATLFPHSTENLWGRIREKQHGRTRRLSAPRSPTSRAPSCTRLVPSVVGLPLSRVRSRSEREQDGTLATYTVQLVPVPLRDSVRPPSATALARAPVPLGSGLAICVCPPIAPLSRLSQ